MDNKKCLMINGAIERKDGKEIDINNFVDKFVNFIEQEEYFYGGSFEYDKKLEEKELREYTKSEMLDLESRIESLIEDLNKELNKKLFIGYRFDLNNEFIKLFYDIHLFDNAIEFLNEDIDNIVAKHMNINEYTKICYITENSLI